MYSEYEPGSYIEHIAPIPLLVQVAENDVFALTDIALEAFNRAREIKNLHLFPGGHLSAYLDKINVLSTTAAECFKRYLCS
jgi:hypothetical protein